VAGRGKAVPLTDFQRTLLAKLAVPPTDDRYLAGGAALHFAPSSTRFSDDLDFFHDSETRVAAAFAADRDRLTRADFTVEVELSLPGFVRAVVRHGERATRVDWAHDSAWRFMPLVRDELGGLLLHPIDLAVNKVLALAGRDEPRDFVDILFVHGRVLPLAALCWAVYTVLFPRRPAIHPTNLMLVTIVMGMAILLPFYLWEAFLVRSMPLAPQTYWAVGYLGLIAGGVCYLCFNRMVEVLGANRAGLTSYLVPIVGTALAIFFLDEQFQAFHAAGIGLILIGVVFATRTRRGSI